MKKEKAAQALQHLSGGGQMQIEGFGDPSEFYSTTQASERQAAIADFLSAGAENAITLSTLVNLTGKDARTVRLLIQRDRAEGFPICSDNMRGYYMPRDEGEKLRCVRSMRHRAREVQRTADNIERGRRR